MYFSDRVCAALTECKAGAEYEKAGPEKHKRKDYYVKDRVCVKATICTPEEYAAAPAAARARAPPVSCACLPPALPRACWGLASHPPTP